jgi:hypothetical protein
MKMVKSLLLVSAAGFVAVPGAQAADLPVKAKPVEYVKVCSLYGAGFYYIPGTDICMKIGGFVRYQVNVGTGNSISFGPFNTTSGINSRSTNVDVAQRVRVVVSQDTRQQTAYGTLRTYLILGWTHDTPTTTTSPAAPGVYFNRGFIQIAGFTFGKATSFFDFASTASVAYNAGFVSTSDTGDPGQIVAAYTAQLGNGVSATVSMEQSRRAATQYLGTPAALAGFGANFSPLRDDLGNAVAGTASRPDFTANIRIDQAWGSAQLSGALHDVSTQYYGGSSALEGNGHPDDDWGWAVAGGLRLNAPMIARGDFFQTQATYSQGAIKYASNSACAGNSTCDFWEGNSVGFGVGQDAVFGGTAAAAGAFGNQLELTTAWSIYASYEHFWTPSLRTSIYGSYLDVSYNGNATGRLCTAYTGTVPGAAGAIACDPDWSLWSIGSRTQWNIQKDFYVGVDVIYSKLNSVSLNNDQPFAFVLPLPANKTPAELYSTDDKDAVTVTWRIHRDIVP